MSRPTCDSCGASKDDDWYICHRCQTKTAERLKQITKLHRALANNPSLKLPQRTEQERPQGGPTRGAPANLHAIGLTDKRSDVRSVLTPWVEDIQERINSQTPVPTDVELLCKTVSQFLPWCASNHQESKVLVSEIKEQYSLLKMAVVGGRRPPKPIPCPVVLPESGACDGTLFLQNDGTVICKNCESSWPYDTWNRLAGMVLAK